MSSFKIENKDNKESTKSTTETTVEETNVYKALKFKKLHEDAVLPVRAYEYDGGLDLTAIDVMYDAEKDAFIYYTGLAIEIPVGFAGFILPRSSIRDTESQLANSIGFVDCGFRGEIEVTFKNRDRNLKIQPYKVGERVAQLAIVPIEYMTPVFVDELSPSMRGEKGHGSSGK